MTYPIVHLVEYHFEFFSVANSGVLSSKYDFSKTSPYFWVDSVTSLKIKLIN